MIGDIKKMYHTVKIKTVEQQTQKSGNRTRKMGVLFNPRIRKGLKAESCRIWSPQQRLVVSKVKLWYRFRVKEGFLFQAENHRVPKCGDRDEII